MNPSVVAHVASLLGVILLVSDQPATDARQFLTDCLGWGQLNIKIPKLVKM